MTVPESTQLARRLVGQAQSGEQIEVCAGSAVRTEVRVHGGEVESLTVAESRGVGVRVIVDGREGFAHPGTFDPVTKPGVLEDYFRGINPEGKTQAELFAGPPEQGSPRAEPILRRSAEKTPSRRTPA